MKFSYRLTKVCGNIYENGNLLFISDGNILLSPIGNRITMIDLIQHQTSILPFENKKNIRQIIVSHSGRFLISVDVDGHALFINLPRQVILTRFHFKRKVYNLSFSNNDKYFAVTYGHGIQIWKTPNITKEFSPLVLSRTLGGFSDDTICLKWSSDSENLVVGSKDLTLRVFYRVHSKKMALSVLTGHRAKVIGVFYSSDNEQIYSVARDGAVFTWEFEYADRIPILPLPSSTISDSEKSGSSDEESESEEEEEKEKKEEAVADVVRTRRGGMWKLKEREFLWDSQTEISSASFNPKTNLLVIGFTSGIFGLYSMPNCQTLHKLSVSNNDINSVDINTTGEWLAIGSKSLGQLLVWEWQSESYVIKQQGHMYGLNALDFSSDGMYIATGGEDSKVKVWNVSSGFCFVTFSKHIGPITGVKFIGKGTGLT
jgi:periodic tryptophan protein 2